MSKIASRTGLNRQQLYRTLSREGNPELRSLTKILDASGLQFVVAAKPARTNRTAKRRRSKSELVKLAA
jgi:DNA-binding phage protein